MTPKQAMLELADEYEAGMRKCAASGYEEYGPDFQKRQQMVIDALRFAARSAQQTEIPPDRSGQVYDHELGEWVPKEKY